MNNSYDLHSWSKQYREESLAQARVRHLEHRAKAHRSARMNDDEERTDLKW